jgi:hypothetical protein
MSDVAYDYARYDGDSRSSWERLTWIECTPAYPRQQSDDLSRGIIDDPVMVSEEVPGPDAAHFDQNDRGGDMKPASVTVAYDQIDLDWRKWDSFDFVTVLGIILVALGFITAFLPELRRAGVLVPVGLGIMTLGILGARRKDDHI